MQLKIGPHLDETDLEQYSLGTLSEDRLPPFEEHLLACDSCQDRLLEMEAYVNAVRKVSPKLRKAPKPWWHELSLWRRPAWIGAVIVGLTVLSVGRVWMTRAHPRTEVVSVFLRSSRGIEGLDIAKVPAAKPLSLEIDLSELPAFPHYRLEVVNSMGKPVWQTPVAGRERRISQPLTTGLAAGQYYVRLYNPSGELLREFGLRVD